MFYLTTHSTHFILRLYGVVQIASEETRCRHMGYSFRLAARVLLYASSHRQDNTYQSWSTWLEREIAQWVHPMKDRSDDPSLRERTLLPRSYISLLPIDEDRLSLEWIAAVEMSNGYTNSSLTLS